MVHTLHPFSFLLESEVAPGANLSIDLLSTLGEGPQLGRPPRPRGKGTHKDHKNGDKGNGPKKPVKKPDTGTSQP